LTEFLNCKIGVQCGKCVCRHYVRNLLGGQMDKLEWKHIYILLTYMCGNYPVVDCMN